MHKDSNFSISSQTYFLFFLIVGILMYVRWYLIVILICISLILMVSIFSCLSANCSVKSFVCFFFFNWYIFNWHSFQVLASMFWEWNCVDHMIILCLTFEGLSDCFSQHYVKLPISPYPHQHLLSFFKSYSHPRGCEMVPRGFDLHFLSEWWYCLWRNVFSPLPIFNWTVSLFVVKICYLFWILNIYHTQSANIFS